MADDQAKIIVGASPVAADRRHTYLLFERSDGSRVVVRGGPDARAEGNDIANLAESTLLGSDKFGHIRVDAAPYEPPYQAVYQRQADGSIRALPAAQADPNDPALFKDAKGNVVVQQETAPDWPLPGETHERVVAWRGTDQELEQKLAAALKAGHQINDAKLEYSPLYNNSNGVTSTLMKAADVRPILPNGKDGQAVTAPNFGENLHQDVGAVSTRSGYWFDGRQWYDAEDRKVQPPHSEQPVVPLDPSQKGKSGSFDSADARQDHRAAPAYADMRDPSHPDNPRFQQAHAGVVGIDRERGREPDEISAKLAAALAVQSKIDGLDGISHVKMNQEGTRAFAVDTPDPSSEWAKRSSVDVAAAVTQPIEVSNEKLQQVNQSIAMQQQINQNPSQEEQARSGPRMA
jgi:hypothetical protein